MITEDEDNNREEYRAKIEELQLREYIATFMGSTGLLALGILAKVPVGVSPDGVFPAHIKAPWIFGGIQELLFYTPAEFAGILFPLVSIILLLSLPLWERRLKRIWVNVGIYSLLGFWVVLTTLYFLK